MDSFKESIGLFFKTWPFLALKFLVYFGISIGFLLFWGVMFFIAVKVGGVLTLVILLFGLLLTWAIIKFIRSYVLYLVKAGHIAVLAELVSNGQVPAGTNQVSYGFGKVKSRFAASSVFFIIDGVINWATRKITGFIDRIGGMIPVDNIRFIFSIISKIVGIFLSNVDEAILSYIFINPRKSVVDGAKDGLVLYSKVWKDLMKSSSVIVLITYGLTFIVFIAAFIPAMIAASLIPIDFLKDMPFIIALIFAFFLKAAFMDQFTLVYMIVTYNRSIKDKTPESEAMEKLEGLIPGFKKKIEEAEKKIGSKGQPAGSANESGTNEQKAA